MAFVSKDINIGSIHIYFYLTCQENASEEAESVEHDIHQNATDISAENKTF